MGAFEQSLWKHWAIYLKYFLRKKADDVIAEHRLLDIIAPDANVIILKNETPDDPSFTILTVDQMLNPEKVTKIAFSGIGRKRVENEIHTLKRIKDQTFSPELLSFGKEPEFSYFTTKAFPGKKMTSNEVTDEIIDMMLLINNLEIKSTKSYGNPKLKKGFAHGDFCPWNIIIDDGFHIFDWEMSGHYPIGFDLFLFIFQYEILINNNDDYCSQILQKHQDRIENYFERFDIENYMPYFEEFVKLRVNQVTNYPIKRALVRYMVEIA